MEPVICCIDGNTSHQIASLVQAAEDKMDHFCKSKLESTFMN